MAQDTNRLIAWLIGTGRQLGDPVQIVQGYCARLRDLGEKALVTTAIAAHAPDFGLQPIGAKDLRGLHHPVELFRFDL